MGLLSTKRCEIDLGGGRSALIDSPGDCPPVFITMIYHSMEGDAFPRSLESLYSIDYPKDRILLCLIDNYSRDGAFDFCKNWLKNHGQKYGGILHIRAKGSPSRLRNIALKTAQELEYKYFAFIESDIIIDKEFLRVGLELLTNEPSVVSVSTVWDVGYENLDFLEKQYAKWLKARRVKPEQQVTIGEACNTSACLINLEAAKNVGYFDEDIKFIEDLDWGRRATRKGLKCLFDSRVIVKHLRKYSLSEIRNYFFAGARSEAKLLLKKQDSIQSSKKHPILERPTGKHNPIPANLYPAPHTTIRRLPNVFPKGRGIGALHPLPTNTPNQTGKISSPRYGAHLLANKRRIRLRKGYNNRTTRL